MSSATSLQAKTLTFVLAGGEGARLYPLTAEQPKPVVPFGGVFRIIDLTFSNVLNSGLRRISVLTQYKHERLHSYVRVGWPRLCSEFEFRRDRGEDMVCLPPSGGKRYRGTADAVFQNLDMIEKSDAEYVLIVSGDQIYHMDYRELLHRHHAGQAELTIAAVEYPVELSGSLGVIETDPSGRVTAYEQKPVAPQPRQSDRGRSLVNMGVYVFGKEALIDTLRKNVDLNGSDDFGEDILPIMARTGRTVVFQFGGYWRDVGTLDLYYQSNLDLLLTGGALDPYDNAAWPTRTLAGTGSLQRSWLSSESRVSIDATLSACELWRSIVSAGARIDAEAELEAAVVLPGARIGTGARIRNTIVAENAVVPPHACIGYDAKVDRSRFPVTENGIVIVCASDVDPARVPQARSTVRAPRSTAPVGREDADQQTPARSLSARGAPGPT